MLVFAPGRIKENFQLNVKGNELIISYTPPEGFPQFDWIKREYSRGAFERTLLWMKQSTRKTFRPSTIDGVLQVTLPASTGKETTSQEIKVS